MRLLSSSLVLAALVAEPQGDAGRSVAPALACSGSGPTFGLLLDANRASLSLPPARTLSLEGRFSSAASRSWGWRGRTPTRGGDLVAFVDEAACTDALGETSPFSVRVSLPDGRFVSGCCRRAGGEPGQEPEAEPPPPPSTAPTPAPALGAWI